MTAPRELIFRDEATDAPARLYACSTCGQCYSPKAYAAREDQCHEAARGAAERCCQPVHCSCCGVPVERPWTACAACRERRMLRNATPIPASEWTDPVHRDDMAGDWGEGYSGSVEELLEHWQDRHWCEHGPQVPPPAYCWPCKSSGLDLDPESILERALEEMHEDAADDLIDVDAFHEFVDGWREKQTVVSWYPDHTRVVVIDPERFAALLEGGKP